MRLHSLLYQNKAIEYFTLGHGPSVVLLHGFIESKNIWKPFAEKLSANYTIIAIDLPGHGKSENLGSVHTMEEMAGAIYAILNYEHVKQCVMIGHSMGGYVALAFAEQYPELLYGLGLFHSHALEDTPEARENRDRTIAVVKNNHKDFISHFIPDLFAPENRERCVQAIESLRSDALSMTSDSIIAALQGMKVRSSRLHVLAEIPVPILFIVGKKDTRADLGKMLVQIAMPAHSEALILSDVGHMGYIESPDLTFNFLEGFLNRAFSVFK